MTSVLTWPLTIIQQSATRTSFTVPRPCWDRQHHWAGFCWAPKTAACLSGFEVLISNLNRLLNVNARSLANEKSSRSRRLFGRLYRLYRHDGIISGKIATENMHYEPVIQDRLPDADVWVIKQPAVDWSGYAGLASHLICILPSLHTARVYRISWGESSRPDDRRPIKFDWASHQKIALEKLKNQKQSANCKSQFVQRHNKPRWTHSRSPE